MKLTRLCLHATDLDAIQSFYTGVLGLKLVDHNTDTISFQAGSTTLMFRQSAIINPVYHFAFTIPANKLDEAYQSLQGKVHFIEGAPGVPIVDFSNWNAKSFYFLDNSGNVLEFIVRFDLHNEAPQPFSGEQICAVSEIGLVTESVPTLSKYLEDFYGLPAFEKQPMLDNFAAIGNDHGLLILSAKGRHWYPTDIEAEAFPAEIFFSHDNGAEQRLYFDRKDALPGNK